LTIYKLFNWCQKNNTNLINYHSVNFPPKMILPKTQSRKIGSPKMESFKDGNTKSGTIENSIAEVGITRDEAIKGSLPFQPIILEMFDELYRRVTTT
jgi:hypothetical protein